MDLAQSIVRIVNPDGTTAGTGFLVLPGNLVLTCAHVVPRQPDGSPTARVAVEFFRDGERLPGSATLRRKCWREVAEGDIAVLEVDPPPHVQPLALGGSAHSEGHRFETFGFPAARTAEGLRGYGVIGGLVRDPHGLAQLQLAQTSELTTGFSGAPIWDVPARRVVGMVVEITTEDRYGRLDRTAFAVPTDALLELLRHDCPELCQSDECPYLGLDPFAPGDAEVFCGRARLIDRLVERLHDEPRFLALLGPSGSGKSSVIQAGLIPAIRSGALPRSDRWEVLITRPTSYAFGRLQEGTPAPAALTATARRRLEAADGSGRTAVYIDQFEELFTGFPPPTQGAVLAHLGELLNGELDLCLILSMRDEFFGRLKEIAAAGGAAKDAERMLVWIERGLVNVPPIVERQELEDMIARPAQARGLRLQPGLAERIIENALADAPRERRRGALATILPLLQFALSELWSRREQGELTLAAYCRIGRLTGALVDWAEQTFAAFAGPDQVLARRVLTDLVAPGDERQGIPDTRRRCPMAQLSRVPEERRQVEAVVHRLVGSRLLVTAYEPSAGETVELIHDTLLYRWPRLGRWLEEDQRFLRWRAELQRRVTRYERKEGALLHQYELQEALEWCRRKGPDLRAAERAFIDESERQEREARERLQHLYRDAARQRVKALAAAAALEVERGAGTRGLLLALEALEQPQADPDAAAGAEAALLRALLNNRERRILSGDSQVNRALFSPDGRLILGACRDGQARLWEVRSGRLTRALAGHAGQVFSAVFSPDGRSVATASSDKTARIINLEMGTTAILSGHCDVVIEAGFSPDGRLVITASEDGTARLWCAATGALLNALYGHHDALTCARFSPAGDRALTTSKDTTARLWEVASGACLARLDGHGGTVHDGCFSPDGERVATASDEGAVRLWRSADGALIASAGGHRGAAVAAAFSAQGDLLVTAGADGTVRLFDGRDASPRAVPMRHQGPVFDVRVSPDGAVLTSASADGTLGVWEAALGDALAMLRGHAGAVWRCAVSPNGASLASAGEDGTVRLWDLALGRPRSLLVGAGATHCARFSPDGTLIASGHEDCRARIWAVATGMLEAVLEGHGGPIWDLAFAPGGGLLATASVDGTARTWDLVRGCTPAATLVGHQGRVGHVTFADDGRRIATCGGDGRALLWDPAGRQLLALEGHAAEVWQVLFLPGGRRIATASYDKTARLWDAESGVLLAVLAAHKGPVVAIACSPDGATIATASLDGTVALFDGATGRQRSVLIGHKDQVWRVAVAPDGQRLLSSSSDNSARLWDPLTGRLVAVLEGHQGQVVAAGFCPRARLALTASWDGTARLWHAATGRPVMVLRCGPERLSTASFSPDGRRVLAASCDGTLRLFDLPIGPGDDWVACARSIAPRGLSEEERRQYG